MSGVRILSAAKSVPKHSMSNHDLSEMVETSDEWITQRTGIRSRFVCTEETTDSLAVQAAQKAIDAARETDPSFSKDEIDLVIVATSTARYAFPSAASGLQKELRLKKTVLTFDLHSACTGFVSALQTARAFLESGNVSCALVVGAEQMTRLLDYTDRGTCILFGDGAGAVIVKRDEKGMFYETSGTDSDHEILYARGYGANPWVHMNGREVYRFAVSMIPQMIESLLKKAECCAEDVDLYLCHQANARIIEHVRKKFPDVQNRFFINLQTYGNTSAASIPIALADLFETGELKKGKRILLTAFGAGLSWNGILMTL